MIKNKKNREKIEQIQQQRRGGDSNDIAIIEERRNNQYGDGGRHPAYAAAGGGGGSQQQQLSAPGPAPIHQQHNNGADFFRQSQGRPVRPGAVVC